MLSRFEALAAVVGDPREFAVIAGLGSAVLDMVRLSGAADTVFPLDGAMGAAVPMGLGLALARPQLGVLVVTGDGELLMNVGSLATVAVQDPGNLSILCVDNGQYVMTGGQATHTSFGTDVAAMGLAAGLREAVTCRSEPDLAEGARVLRSTAHASLVVLKVRPEPSLQVPVDRDAAACRVRFAAAVRRLNADRDKAGR
jgi:phosphonopyruvate decarboxylase